MTYPVKFRQHVLSIREKEGLTLEETSQRFGVGRASLTRWLKRLEPDQYCAILFAKQIREAGMKQQSFSSLEQSQKKKRTKRDVFLREMDRVVPWVRLEALIALYYVKPKKGRPQMPLSTMLRIYFLQQWYGLSDPAAEEALYDMHSMRDFAELDLGCDAIPDETTILNFRHLLERHNLSEALFGEVSQYLQEHALLLRGGSILDATLIAASPSTKNKSGKRDPEMAQTKKGNQWYFGAKMHIGVGAHSGLVHTEKLTKASRHDAALTDDLIRPDDRAIFGDKGYVSDKRKCAARAAGVFWGVKDKRKRGRGLSASQKKRNRRHGMVRAKVEHVFRVIKCQFGYRKVRYRGLAKRCPDVHPERIGQSLSGARKAAGGVRLKSGIEPQNSLPLPEIHL